MRTAIFVVAAFGIAATPLLAQTAEGTADTVRIWGLIGEWSTEDCKLPLAVRQRHTVWFRVDPDGEVVYDNSVNLGLVETASATREGNIALRINTPATNEKRAVVFERTDRGIRSIMSNAKNEYSIKDGRLTATGEPAEVLKRCR